MIALCARVLCVCIYIECVWVGVCTCVLCCVAFVCAGKRALFVVCVRARFTSPRDISKLVRLYFHES